MMELWTDYEGRTIDGDYPLTKLIRSEGRSAFFSTSNGTGVPTVIRVIESHFDDEEILARWRGITALHHANLVEMKKYGHVVLDETSLVYAVMEPVEANLGEIVRERRLTVLETRQVASSVLAALEALHANGFVHEHVEPANVLAVGETIKLRSDCIREAPEGEDGRALKARDVHDFAVLLLQCLTQQRTLESAARDLPLAAPFDEMVRKGISGEWGLAQMAKVLPPVAVARAAAPAVAAPASSASASKSAPRTEPGTVGSAAVAPLGTAASEPASGAAAASHAAASRSGAGASPATAGMSGGVSGTTAAAASSRGDASPAGPANRRRAVVEEEPAGLGRGTGLRALIALLAVVILFFGWRSLHKRPASEGTAPPPVSTPAPILENGAAMPGAVRTPPVVQSEAARGNAAAPVTRPAEPVTDPAAVPSTGQWRVVAFTYNHEDQARQKAEALTKAHPDLRMGVFTPNGRAPYMVTIGGPMSREAAFALAGKAKREGLPRDIYAQNYRGRR